MKVVFRTKRLLRAYEQEYKAIRLWGPAVARKYIQRVEALYAAQNFHDIRRVQAFRPHPLGGPHEGEWALDLTGRWRLIVIPSGGGDTVTVQEVTKHYGD